MTRDGASSRHDDRRGRTEKEDLFADRPEINMQVGHSIRMNVRKGAVIRVTLGSKDYDLTVFASGLRLSRRSSS